MIFIIDLPAHMANRPFKLGFAIGADAFRRIRPQDCPARGAATSGAPTRRHAHGNGVVGDDLRRRVEILTHTPPPA